MSARLLALLNQVLTSSVEADWSLLASGISIKSAHVRA